MSFKVEILSKEDICFPTDFCRPLIRSADYSYYDEWMDESCYSGNPLDHLKWCPVWLHLGKCWWGKKYKSYFDFSQFGKYYEFVRGNIPNDHIIKNKKYDKRHPLWFESYLIEKKNFDKYIFKVGKYKGRTVKNCLENIFPHSELIEYFHWYFNKVDNSKKEIFEDYLKEYENKIYYEPEFKKFIK